MECEQSPEGFGFSFDWFWLLPSGILVAAQQEILHTLVGVHWVSGSAATSTFVLKLISQGISKLTPLLTCQKSNQKKYNINVLCSLGEKGRCLFMQVKVFESNIW